MKLKNLLLLSGLVGWATTAQAQVVVYLTGSTAFRAQTYAGITNLYGANLTSVTPANATGGTGKLTFTGTMPTLYGAQTVTIKASYSGSVEGVVNLLNAPNPPGVVQPTYLNVDGTPDNNSVADIALCDVFQDTTDYNTTIYPALDDTTVGVVCFQWTRSVVTTNSVKNISHQQAQQLFASGTVPVSFLSGNPADTQLIYLAGRYKLSGTRLVYQADSGFGANGDALLYKLSSTNTPVQDTVGFTGGGAVATLLNTVAATAPFLGTVGTSDSATINGGANALTFAGAPFTLENVRNGIYSLWSYEHAFVRPGLSATKVKLLRGSTKPTDPIHSNGLAKAIDDVLGTSTLNVQLSTMKVSRNSDGGVISP